MDVSISHPTNRPNYSEVTIGDVELFFSYRTLVAFRTPESGLVIRTNAWGPTTGRHLNYISTTRDRVNGETFREMVAQYVTTRYGLVPQS